MYPGTAEFLAAQYLDERLRDGERERLARRARRQGPPLRARLAERLHALATRIDVPAHLRNEPATA